MTDAEIKRERKSHIWAREANEHYVEPAWCSRRLFEEETFGTIVHDPCCGFGRIPESAKASGLAVVATDLIDRGYTGLLEAENFLDTEGCYGDIVCNPPFNIASQFALHALSIAAEKVAIIFPTARLNAAHWLKGTPLRRVWMLSPRPSMPPGHVITAGGKPQGGKMDYCWLVWERDYQGPAEIRWLYRDKRA